MNKLLSFYLTILIPLVIIFTLIRLEYIYPAVISLLLYTLVYRPITDYKKLKASGLNDDLPYWKMFFVPYRIKYFKELYMMK